MSSVALMLPLCSQVDPCSGLPLPNPLSSPSFYDHPKLQLCLYSLKTRNVLSLMLVKVAFLTFLRGHLSQTTFRHSSP